VRAAPPAASPFAAAASPRSQPLPASARARARVTAPPRCRRRRRRRPLAPLSPGSADKTLRLWDLATGAPLAVSRPLCAVVRSIAADERALVVGATSPGIRIWHAAPPGSDGEEEEEGEEDDVAGAAAAAGGRATAVPPRQARRGRRASRGRSPQLQRA